MCQHIEHIGGELLHCWECACYGSMAAVHLHCQRPRAWIRQYYCAVQLCRRPEALTQGGWGDWTRRYRGMSTPADGSVLVQGQIIVSGRLVTHGVSAHWSSTPMAHRGAVQTLLSATSRHYALQLSSHPKAAVRGHGDSCMRSWWYVAIPGRGMESEAEQTTCSGRTTMPGDELRRGTAQPSWFVHMVALSQRWVRPCHCTVQLYHHPDAHEHGGWGDWRRRCRSWARSEGGLESECDRNASCGRSVLTKDSQVLGVMRRLFYDGGDTRDGNSLHGYAAQQRDSLGTAYSNDGHRMNNETKSRDGIELDSCRRNCNYVALNVCGAAVVLMLFVGHNFGYAAPRPNRLGAGYRKSRVKRHGADRGRAKNVQGAAILSLLMSGTISTFLGARSLVEWQSTIPLNDCHAAPARHGPVCAEVCGGTYENEQSTVGQHYSQLVEESRRRGNFHVAMESGEELMSANSPYSNFHDSSASAMSMSLTKAKDTKRNPKHVSAAMGPAGGSSTTGIQATECHQQGRPDHETAHNELMSGGIEIGPCIPGQCARHQGACARGNYIGSSFLATWRAARTYRPLVMVQGKRRRNNVPGVMGKAVVGSSMAGTVGTRTVKAYLPQADGSDHRWSHNHSAPVDGGLLSCSVVEPLLDGSPLSATWVAARDQGPTLTSQGEGKVRETVGIWAAAALWVARAGTVGTRRCLLFMLGAPGEGIDDWPSQVMYMDSDGYIANRGPTIGTAFAETGELVRTKRCVSLRRPHEERLARMALRGGTAGYALINPYGGTSTGYGQELSDLIHHQAAIIIVDCSADDESSSSEQRSRHGARTKERTTPSNPSPSPTLSPSCRDANPQDRPNSYERRNDEHRVEGVGRRREKRKARGDGTTRRSQRKMKAWNMGRVGHAYIAGGQEMTATTPPPPPPPPIAWTITAVTTSAIAPRKVELVPLKVSLALMNEVSVIVLSPARPTSLLSPLDLWCMRARGTREERHAYRVLGFS